LISANKGIEDSEQAYILSELVRYFQHDSSGITHLTRMDKSWKPLCESIQQAAPISKNDATVSSAVSSWQQLLRYLAISLSVSISQPVSIALGRTKANSPDENLKSDICAVVDNQCLTADFDIPNAASKLTLTADLVRRTISLSMRIEAPKDKTRASSSVIFLTRQLKNITHENLSVRAYWPKRIPMTMTTLQAAIDDPMALVGDIKGEIPTYLEVICIIDLAGKFKGPKTFVEEMLLSFEGFYANAGSSLTKWVPKPPKVQKHVSSDAISPVSHNDITTQPPT